MVQRTRARGDMIPHAAELLDVMGRCRDRLIDASSGVRPFGTAYHAVHLVTTAIDTLAFFITGQQHFYAIGGSTGPSTTPPRPAVSLDDADEPE